MPDKSKRTIDQLLLWMGASALAMALLATLAAAWMQLSATPRAPTTQTMAVAAREAPSVADGAQDMLQPTQWRHFALNALLAPLIDDAEPGRWTDVGLDFFCDEGTRVLINGKPLVAGEPVPATAFSIRWDMGHCEPLGPATPLSGGVDLLVSHEAGGLTALVVPDRLQVHSRTGVAHIGSPFTATLSLVRAASDP